MARRRHTAEIKKKVAIEAIKEQKTLIQIAKEFEVHPVQVSTWRKQLLDNATSLFGARTEGKGDSEAEVAALERKVGRLTMENDFLKKKLGV